uniref:Uncharacterized protein n=1 Tax=Manihot esculenta TaxID=3983 RepID=A0A2C9V4R2_MANES
MNYFYGHAMISGFFLSFSDCGCNEDGNSGRRSHGYGFGVRWFGLLELDKL